MRARIIGRILVQLAISAVLIGALAWRVDVHGLTRALRAADWRWIVAAVPLMAASKATHGVRWWLLVRRLGRVPLVGAVLVLLAATGVSVVLPLRAGAALQLQVMRRRYGVERSAVSGTLVVEGLLDAVMLLAFALVVVPLVGLPRRVVLAAVIMAGAAGSITGAIALLGAARGGQAWLRYLPRWLRARAARFTAGLARGVAALGSPRLVLLLLLVTLVDWTFATASYWLVGRALGLDVPPVAYLAVEIVGNLSGAVPLTQANVGPYELAAQQALVLFGAAGAAAAATAVAAHAMVIAADALVGVAAAWALGLRRADLLYLRVDHAERDTDLPLGSEHSLPLTTRVSVDDRDQGVARSGSSGDVEGTMQGRWPMRHT